jgi:flagellar basal body-associated protein FliL
MKLKFNSGNSLVMIIIAAALALGIAGGCYYYFYVGKPSMSTENAISTNEVDKQKGPTSLENQEAVETSVISNESLSKEIDSLSTIPSGAEDFSSNDTAGL